MKRLIAVILIFALCMIPLNNIHAQDMFDKSTRFAVGIGLQDMYDAIHGDAKIGAIIQFAPIIPTLGNVYTLPLIRAGYDENWQSSIGTGIAYYFGNYYVRYNMEFLEIQQNSNFATGITNEMGFGLPMPTFGLIDDFYIDIFYKVNNSIDEPKQKEEVRLSFVKIW